jgi:hypothetical protein
LCLLGRLPGEKEIRGCSVRGWRGGERVGGGGGGRPTRRARAKGFSTLNRGFEVEVEAGMVDVSR